MSSDHYLPGCIRTSILAVSIIALGAAAACDESSDAGSRSDTNGNTGQSSSGGGPNGTGPNGDNPGGGSSGSSGGNGAPDGGDPGTPAVPYVDFAVNHVLVTGQSNSVANSGTPVLSTTQPYSNVMFNTGVMPMTQCDGVGCRAFDPPSSFVPLVEGDNFFGYGVETSGADLVGTRGDPDDAQRAGLTAGELTDLFEQRDIGGVQGAQQEYDRVDARHTVLGHQQTQGALGDIA